MHAAEFVEFAARKLHGLAAFAVAEQERLVGLPEQFVQRPPIHQAIPIRQPLGTAPDQLDQFPVPFQGQLEPLELSVTDDPALSWVEEGEVRNWG